MRRLEWRVRWWNENWGANTSPKSRAFARKADAARFVNRRQHDGCVVFLDARRVSQWELQSLSSLPDVTEKLTQVRRTPSPLPSGIITVSSSWGAYARRFLAESGRASRR